MHIERYVKIICTLGPACANEAMIGKMIDRGMNVARLNFSHGNHKGHAKLIELVRSVNKKKGSKVSILADLAGYRIRIGHLKKNRVLENSQILYMSYDQNETKDHVPFDYSEDTKSIPKGAPVFIDDGRLHLKVMSNTGKKLKLKVIHGGVLKERKGVNIPTMKLQANILTDYDKEDILFAIEHKVEKISQSFVRNKKDIQRVVDMVRPNLTKCKVIAKIESLEGVRNIESIVDSCDGVMVARGDLGVSVPIYKLPMMQKYIIRHCNRKKKLSITATQMLDSMIENGRPTRAEVTDIANAIIDGTDYVMLSGETAVGKYPSRSVMTMSQIVAYTEKYNNIRPM